MTTHSLCHSTPLTLDPVFSLQFTAWWANLTMKRTFPTFEKKWAENQQTYGAFHFPSVNFSKFFPLSNLLGPIMWLIILSAWNSTWPLVFQMKQCLKNIQSLTYEWEAAWPVFFLFTIVLESERDCRNQLAIQQVKILLESNNEVTVLLWVKSTGLSGIWRPQSIRPEENGHHRVALPGNALKHDSQLYVCLKFCSCKGESYKCKYEWVQFFSLQTCFNSAYPTGVVLF